MQPTSTTKTITIAVLAILLTIQSAVVKGQAYNKLRTINYAWQYAGIAQWQPGDLDNYDTSGYNQDYLHPTDGALDDCTDFVSQCMRAGGWTDIGGSHSWDFYFDSNWFFHDRTPHHYSRSWSYAGDLYSYLAQSGNGEFVDVLRADPGDVMFADWGDGHGISHAMLVTRKRDWGNIAFTQHSPNRKNKPWSAYPQATYYCFHFHTSDKVEYQAQVQNYGWMAPVADTAPAGTTGQSLRMETIRILTPGRKVSYTAHVQNYGWMDWVQNGEDAGTVGKGLRMEAIRIQVDRGHVYYRAHVQGIGWMDWVRDGSVAGTVGRGLRMEALQIQITD